MWNWVPFWVRYEPVQIHRPGAKFGPTDGKLLGRKHQGWEGLRWNRPCVLIESSSGYQVWGMGNLIWYWEFKHWDGRVSSNSGAGKMVQWGKVPAAKPHNVSSTPGTPTWWNERTYSQKLCFELHIHIVAHDRPPTQSKQINVIKKIRINWVLMTHPKTMWCRPDTETH